MHQSLALALIRRGVIKRRTILQIQPPDRYAPSGILIVAGIRQVGQRLIFLGEPGDRVCMRVDAAQVITVYGMPILRVAESVALDEVGNHAPQLRCRSPMVE